MLRTSVHAACESLAVGGQCKSPVWQGTQERGARTSPASKTSFPAGAVRTQQTSSHVTHRAYHDDTP
jgi:hypothetical protein